MIYEKLTDFGEALKAVLEIVRPLGAEENHIENCRGLTLAREVRAEEDIPAFDNSAMDGFALISEDTRGASKSSPIRLRVADGVARAGVSKPRKITQGEAIRIMTGAPIPNGADAVIMIEKTSLDKGGGKVVISDFVEKGRNIRAMGEDIKKGKVILSYGKILYPADIGLLASLGIYRIKVVPKPKIGVLTSGSEIVLSSEKLSVGEVRDSNKFTLISLIRETGATVNFFKRVTDDVEHLKKSIVEGVSHCDILVTSGGISMGKFDFVGRAVEALGARRVFWGVRKRPGMPSAFWVHDGKPIFGVPGNPVSTMVSFENFVRPAILRAMGREDIFRPMLTATLSTPVKVKKGYVHFLRVRVVSKDGELRARLTGPQGSGILSSMSIGNGLLRTDENISEGSKGEVMMYRPIIKGES